MNYSSPHVKPPLNYKSGASRKPLVYGGLGMGRGEAIGVTETLGDRARKRREELGLSPTEVARRVNKAGRDNVKIQHIQKLESNKQRDVTYLAELAIALECDPFWLSRGQKRPEGSENIDENRLIESWEATETAIAEHEDLHLMMADQVRLALAVYADLGAGADEPLEAARQALTRLLVERLKQSDGA